MLNFTIITEPFRPETDKNDNSVKSANEAREILIGRISKLGDESGF
jgi:hypothetical protein